MTGSPDVLIIGGCGHVGLPLGIVFAKAGLNVELYDTDPQRTALVRDGRMPFIEHGADELLASTIGKTLFVTDGLDTIGSADSVIITIGTPIDEHLSPRHRPLFELVEDIAPRMRPGAQLILRSTVYPGTTRELARRLDELGVHVNVAYCPERIAQGYAVEELDKLPQIVSAFTPEALDAALRLFRTITARTLVVDVEEAELAKLFLNAWRYIQFATANQFFMMAQARGFDFFRVYEAMTTGYERASDFPLPGFAAGPCLLKDTLQLSALEPTGFQLGHAAMLVNEGLVNFVVAQLARERDLSRTTVGILGTAFKANVDDTRDSLAYKLRKELLFRGARVLASDPYVDDPDLVGVEELLDEADVLVVGAPHEAYRELAIPEGTQVVDVWGFYRALTGVTVA